MRTFRMIYNSNFDCNTILIFANGEIANLHWSNVGSTEYDDQRQVVWLNFYSISIPTPCGFNKYKFSNKEEEGNVSFEFLTKEQKKTVLRLVLEGFAEAYEIPDQECIIYEKHN